MQAHTHGQAGQTGLEQAAAALWLAAYGAGPALACPNCSCDVCLLSGRRPQGEAKEAVRQKELAALRAKIEAHEARLAAGRAAKAAAAGAAAPAAPTATAVH